jgi:Yip1 domain
MNLVRRVLAILGDPSAAWVAIAKEAADTLYLPARYAAVLALVPAVFGWLGAEIIGVIVPGKGVVRASIFDALFGAAFSYLVSLAIVLLLGLLIGVLAPAFGGRRDFRSAMNVAAYSYTPVWLAGIFLMLPGLRFLTLTGFYGFYLLATAMPPLMKSPARKSAAFAAVIVVFACALAYAAALGQQRLFGRPGG